MHLTYIASLNVKQNLIQVKRKTDKCAVIMGQIYILLPVIDWADQKLAKT